MKRINKKKQLPALGKRTAFELQFGWSGEIDHVKLKPLKIDNGIGSKLNGARI